MRYGGFFLSQFDKEKQMDAQKVAARFAAYVWFENIKGADRSEEEKARFANTNWKPFMPVAHEGLGRLLMKISAGRSSRQRRRKQSQKQQLITVA